MSMFEIDIMKGEEVEDIIHLEYDVLGASPFAVASVLPLRKKVVVARVNGVIVGCATVCWSEKFEIASLAVAREYRNFGIGSAIIEKCVEIAKELGFDKIWLETPESGPVDLYESHGFVIYSRIKDMYGEGITGLKMVRKINSIKRS